MQGAAGATGGATYVDDVFHTEVFVSPNQNADYKVTNNIDNAGEGGFLWYKQRNGSSWNLNWDTVRGSNKYIYTNSSSAESTGELLKSFDSDGYTIKTGTTLVDPARENVLWNFRKAPGFFDIVTFTSTGAANQRIPHSLECEPGLIICKCVSASSYWAVYHREVATMNPSDPWSKSLLLDENYGAQTYASDTWGTGPTSTDFGFKAGGFAATGADWVAYVFAGGESTAATARSVAFTSGGSSNQNAQSLTIANSSDTDFGSGDFTMECWFKDTRSSDLTDLDTVFSMSGYTNSSNNDSFSIYYAQGGFVMFNRTGGGFDMVVDSRDPVSHFSQVGQWHHFAWTRSGSGTNNNKLWLDGILHAQFTRNVTYANGQDFYIGGNQYSGGGTPNEYGFNGKISNVRITKGQAIYTNSFNPSNEPLTTTTGGATASNVKVICCNNSSITGSSLTSGTISSTNTPTASIDSPFDDIEGYKFGEGGDQNIIKCGSYVGNGNANGPEVYLGWEPQWVMIKRSTSAESWAIVDAMRGIVTGGNDARLQADSSGSESASDDRIDLTPTGFKLISSNAEYNGSDTYVYIAIRRPDGYVGKPAKVGTDVFTMDTGNSSSTGPAFDSNFVVDFALLQQPASAGLDWRSFARLTGTKSLATNTNATETTESSNTSDYNDGFADSYTNVWQSWMFKRHAGFDVVTYTGNERNGRQIPHSLGIIPEMMWLKYRAPSGYNEDWQVYHKGLNGGVDPQDYAIRLDSSNAEYNSANDWADTAPTSTSFTIGGSDGRNNRTNSTYITMLFASVDGISKVGYYTGTGVSGLAVTTGFTPRFLIIKNADWSYGDWFVYDTTRGWASGTNGEVLKLNNTGAQSNSGTHKTSPTSTGFSVDSTDAAVNQNGHNFIYYAHA